METPDSKDSATTRFSYAGSRALGRAIELAATVDRVAR
jgi:hypothetical protein